jgi:hypothetical protein
MLAMSALLPPSWWGVSGIEQQQQETRKWHASPQRESNSRFST